MQSETIQLFHPDASSCSAVNGSNYGLPQPSALGLGVMDSSLTSLNWLPDFQIPEINSLAVQCPSKNNYYNDPPSTTSYHTDDKESTTSSSAEELILPLSPLRRCINQTAEFETNPWRFKENPKKPPFSYTTIIYLAIRSSNNEKVTLGEIYQWIKDHFLYYQLAEPTWQNSVRHNLSLNDFFRKVPRTEGDPGKGSFWQINPDYENVLTNQMEFQRLEELVNSQKGWSKTKGKGRKKLYVNNSNGPSKTNNVTTKDGTSHRRKTRSTNTDFLSSVDHHPYCLPSDLDWVTLLSSQRMTASNGIHNNRPFGSPVMGCPLDMVGDCMSNGLSHKGPLPVMIQPISTPFHNSLEDIITSQESPAPLLPPWAESRSQSPNIEHPWAESKRTTAHTWSPDTWPLPTSAYPSSSNSILPAAATVL